MQYRTRRTLRALRYYARRTLCAAIFLYSAFCAAMLGAQAGQAYARGVLFPIPYPLALAFAVTLTCALASLVFFFMPRYSPSVRAATRAYLARNGG